MNELLIGIIAIILLYILGQLLYPNPVQQRIDYSRGMTRTYVGQEEE